MSGTKSCSKPWMSMSTRSMWRCRAAHAAKDAADALRHSTLLCSRLREVTSRIPAHASGTGSTKCSRWRRSGRATRAKAAARAPHGPQRAPTSAMVNTLSRCARSTAWSTATCSAYSSSMSGHRGTTSETPDLTSASCCSHAYHRDGTASVGSRTWVSQIGEDWGRTGQVGVGGRGSDSRSAYRSQSSREPPSTAESPAR